MQLINYQNRELDESEQTIAIKCNKEGILPGPKNINVVEFYSIFKKIKPTKHQKCVLDVQIMYED